MQWVWRYRLTRNLLWLCSSTYTWDLLWHWFTPIRYLLWLLINTYKGFVILAVADDPHSLTGNLLWLKVPIYKVLVMAAGPHLKGTCFCCWTVQVHTYKVFVMSAGSHLQETCYNCWPTLTRCLLWLFVPTYKSLVMAADPHLQRICYDC